MTLILKTGGEQLKTYEAPKLTILNIELSDIVSVSIVDNDIDMW